MAVQGRLARRTAIAGAAQFEQSNGKSDYWKFIDRHFSRVPNLTLGSRALGPEH